MKNEVATIKKYSREFDNKTLHPLQSWVWGEFRKSSGNEVVRFASMKDKKIEHSYQILIHKIPHTSYKIGTLIKSGPINQGLLGFIKDIAKEYKLIFTKIESAIPTNCGNIEHIKISDSNYTKIMQSNGAVVGKTLFTPTTFWINLTKSEDELLASFSPKTRYNIKLAVKKGVEIAEDGSEKAFQKYIDLTRETVNRQGFYSHTEKYHKLMWKYLHTDMLKNKQEPIARMLTARFKGKIITTWIVFVWNNVLYYPYGASTNRYKNVMANNLMMWEAIKYGKRNGCQLFDLWGREEGKGFTKFKEGYNPTVVTFPQSWDFVTHPVYYLYKIAEFFRWTLLRLYAKLGLSKLRF